MKRYRALARYDLRVRPNSEYEFTEAGELILAPNVGKVFLHWTTKSGKLATTFTLDGSTLVSTPVKLVNSSEDWAIVQVTEI